MNISCLHVFTVCAFSFFKDIPFYRYKPVEVSFELFSLFQSHQQDRPAASCTKMNTKYLCHSRSVWIGLFQFLLSHRLFHAKPMQRTCNTLRLSRALGCFLRWTGSSKVVFSCINLEVPEISFCGIIVTFLGKIERLDVVQFSVQ